jgi:hypothetical protein
VCDHADIYASGCAIARAFPLYNRKTSSTSLAALDSNEISAENNSERYLNIEFICIDKNEVKKFSPMYAN